MKKPTAKEITDSYKRLMSKRRDKTLNKMIEGVCLDLLCSIQKPKQN
jgi:hypothetical protein